MSRRREADGQGVRRLRRRGLGLVLFGACHGLLLFSGDVLGLYGLLTLTLIPMLRWPTRNLIVLAVSMLVLFALVQRAALADPGPTMQRMILWSIGISDPSLPRPCGPSSGSWAWSGGSASFPPSSSEWSPPGSTSRTVDRSNGVR